MDLSPKIALIDQLASTIQSNLTAIAQHACVTTTVSGVENAISVAQAKNPQNNQNYQSAQQINQQIKAALGFLDQGLAASGQITTTSQQWPHIKKDIIENVLPSFTDDARAIITQVIMNIDINSQGLQHSSIHNVVTLSLVFNHLRLLAHYLKNPPILIKQPPDASQQTIHPSPAEVERIFKKGEADTNEQINHYSRAGWAALVFGLGTVAGAVSVALLWNPPQNLSSLSFISALIARLLAVGVLVYIATILLQRHRDMVHLAARAREFRAQVTMISAIPFCAGDKTNIDALTNLLMQMRDKAANPAENGEKGFFLPAEALKMFMPVLEKLTGK